MRSLLLLNCYLFLIGHALAANDGNCQIDDIDDTFYNSVYALGIVDTQIDTVIAQHSYTSTLVVEECTSEDEFTTDYFTVTTNDTHFIIRTTPVFGDLDQNTAKTVDYVDYVLENLRCNLRCSNGVSTLLFQIRVSDVNTHSPVFNLETYEFRVAAPIMPLTDFSIYGASRITATDIDFSNQHITFSVTPDDFTVTTISDSTSKDYSAVFAAKKVIQLTEDVTYSIRATDSGTNPGPRMTTTTFTLKVDEDLSIDTPLFNSASYSFNYTIEDGTPHLITLDGPITVTTHKRDLLNNALLTGEFNTYFDVSLDTASSSIELIPKGTLPVITQSFLILTLSVSTDNVASTSIIVHLLNVDSTPLFSSRVYTGSYSDIAATVTVDGTITITSASTPEVTISGAYSDHFRADCDAITGTCQISVITNLNGPEIKSLSYINLLITATVGENYDTASLILSLPDPHLQFTSALYTAAYNSDNTIAVDDTNPIRFTDVVNVPINIGGSYEANFEITYNSGNDQYSIVVSPPLPDEVLKTEKKIVITLTAADSYGDEAQSVVIIELPNVKTDAPIFSETVYLVEYIADGASSIVTPNNDITISNRDTQDNIKISLDSYNANFEVTYDNVESKWELKLLTPLSDAILLSRNTLIIVMTATEQDNDNPGHAVLSITWATKEAPIFSEAYYVGSYPEDGTGTIELEKEIGFTNIIDPTTVEISLDNYESNFEITYESDRWYINIIDSLDDNILHRNVELVMTLIATEKGNANGGESVLVLKLPTATNGTAPKFSEAYYIANYPEDGTGVIEFNTAISFSNVDDPMSVTLDLDKYSSSFQIKYDLDKWYIVITNSLNDSILHQNVELVMTITATEQRNANKGESALVLKLPTASYGTAPKFSDAYYVANYPEEGTGIIEFESSVSFLNVEDSTTVTINLGAYSDKFEIIYDTDTFRWYINVKSSLDDNVLSKNAELVMTMIATESENKNTGESVLVLKLPNVTNETGPIFTEAYYEAEYVENETDTIEFQSAVAFLNVIDPETVTINLDNYERNFEIAYDSDRWYIHIKMNLDEDVLMKNTEIVLTMVATKTDNINKGYSALVLKLPSANTVTAPKFLEPYYLADYSEINSGVIEFEKPISFLNINDPTTVKISLDSYSDKFEIIYDTDTFRWYINVKSSLDDNVLSKNAELVMTMIATESENENTGESVLVLKLPIVTDETGPIFEDAYYEAEYVEDGTDTIEFQSAVAFLNVIDPETVTINLDNYERNFEIAYDSDRWYIHIKMNLDEDVLMKNTEIVLTMVATKTDNINKGYSALVLKLPSANTVTAPKFLEPYYLADYSEINSGVIEFEKPVTFLNVNDPTTVKINLDSYSDKFEIIYDTDTFRWYINVKSSLDDNVLSKNAELVITMIATQSENENTGESVLVLKLPIVTDETGPIFEDAYYEAEYVEDGTDSIEFQSAVAFLNVVDPETVTINLDNYERNFEIAYDSDRWYIHIKMNLDEDILMKNTEIVLTMVATKTDNINKGYSALVLKLPSANTVTAPKFLESYYLADYSEINSGVIEFEKPVTFLNVNDPTTVKISLDSYSDKFEIIYDTDTFRWYINVKSSLDDNVLSKNAELVMTMIATESENENTGESVLVLKLPIVTDETGPIFTEAYYEAEYVEDGTDTIEFQSAVAFLNVVDPETVTINLDNYERNFEISYDSDRWYIHIKMNLDEDVLMKNTEIVLTMVATKTDNINKGYSALVLKLPSANTVTAPKFLESYYLADYSEINSGVIEFEKPISFLNINDPTTVKISLDSYSDKFEIIYDTDTFRWYINVKSSLDDNVLSKNAELVMTMIATESEDKNTGESVLVLKLPIVTDETGPIFTEAYYEAEYVEDGTDTIEFQSAVAFLNVVDPETVTINLDNYERNFEIAYDSDRWYIHIKMNLDEDILMKNTEIVLTMVATKTDNINKGFSALVLKLPSANTVTAPKFSESYFLADYSEINSGVVEFEKPVTFLNVNDPTTVKINLDSYSDKFEIIYDTDTFRWYINVKSSLDDTVLSKNAELVMTMIATESENENTGESVLVLKLPIVTDETGPIFTEAYYEAEYVEDGTDTIEFQSAVAFLNVIDPESVTINLDNYERNFEIAYDSDRWYIHIKMNLDEDILMKNTEIVLTMVATKTDNINKGYSALVLKLPSANTVTAPKFSESYYLADYSEINSGVIEFEKPVTFLNVNDPTTVKINLDSYSDKFEIVYDTDTFRWYINVKSSLDDNVLSKNAELVMTMTAVEIGNESEGHSALILKLPANTNELAPIFSEAYYLADYPDDGTGIIDFEVPVTFKNVDPNTVTITLDNYADNFEINFVSNKWSIQIKTPLDISVVNENTELVMTLTATETDKTAEGYSALVLKMPEVNDEIAPKFSEAYYAAEYKINSGEATVVFTDAISINNKPDQTRISITVDNYPDNFNVQYDSIDKTWVMKVTGKISDEILLSKTDLVVALTATDIDNGLTGQSVVDLELPQFNTETAPKFSKTYYTGNYTISGATASVTFDVPLTITNRDSLADISVGTDSYTENFNIIFDSESNEWKVNVVMNLDESILNAKVDLVMALLATDESTGEVGESALVLTLPIVNNNDESPKFSRIYYAGEYITDDGGTIELEYPIAITNKNNMIAITISFDDSYQSNFEINYDYVNLVWILNTLSPLSDSILKDKTELILTLTATETNNRNVGQVALVLHLPSSHLKLAPKFALPHYSAEYVVEDGKANIVLEDAITIVNKEDLDNIVVNLDSYSTNFKVSYDSTNEGWTITVIEQLLDDVLKSNKELVLTLVATETSNEYTGDSTLILTLPSSGDDSTEDDLLFSQVHYSADYNVTGDTGDIKMNDAIKVTTKLDVSSLTVLFQNDLYADYFNINQESDSYVVSVRTPLTPEILEKEVSIVLTIVAAVDTAESYATLVINLPTRVRDRAIEFTLALYDGTYKIDDGSFLVTDTIQVETDADDDDVERSISSSTGYEEYFAISYAAKTVTVSMINDIPTNLLRGESLIPLLLTVGIRGTSDSSTAVLNVQIEGIEDSTTAIEFSNVLYHGEYEVSKDGVGQLTINDVITVATDEADENVEVIISNEYGDFFDISYSSNVISVTLNKQLTTEILNSFTVIPLTLQAGIRGTTHQAFGVLNIRITYDNELDTGSVEFGNVLYHGEYSINEDGTGKLVLNEAIHVITDSRTVAPSISNDAGYDKHFTISYARNTVSVGLAENSLPDDVLANSFVALTLTVAITGTTHTSSAVLNIRINGKEQDTGSVKIETVLYDGEYSVNEDGTGNLVLNEVIHVITDSRDEDVIPSISNDAGYDKYFTISYASNTVSLGLAENRLPNDVLANSFIALTLTVAITGTTHTSSAVLNININSGDTSITAIEFSNVLYHGKYEVGTDGVGQLTIEDVITVATDESDENVEVIISNEYGDFFDTSYSDNVISVTLNKQLTTEILNSFTVIPLTLQVGIKGTTHQALAVLNIRITYDNELDTGSVEFGTVLYDGEYSINEDGTGKLVLNDVIRVITDSRDEDVIPTISNDAGYDKHFTISYASNTVSLGLTENSLPDDVLANSFIALTLTVAITGTTHTSSAVLNIRINGKEQDTGSVRIETVLYDGEYSVNEDGTGNLVLNEVIHVITDSRDEDVIPSISNDAGYDKYFTISYASNTVSLGLAENRLPNDVLANSFIALTLTVAITGTTHTSSAVLNININSGDTSITAIEFSNVLYHGKYEVGTDGVGQLTIEDVITVATDEADENVEVIISNEYGDFFDTSYTKNVISVTLGKQLTTEILNSNTFIPLTLQVGIKGTSQQTSAVLNIRITYDSEQDTGSVEFGTVLYDGEYSVNEDGTGKLVLNEVIHVITDSRDEDVIPSITNDAGYDKHFTISYASNTVSLGLAENRLPDDVLANSFIPLTLTVTITGTTHTSSAVLNIKINNEDSSTASIEFSNVLYHGKYEVGNDEVGELTIDDVITVATDEADENVEVNISNEYGDYFGTSYTNNVISVTLAKQLTTEILNTYTFIPLTLQVGIKGTTHQASAVLNIRIIYDNEQDTGPVVEFGTVLYDGEYSINENGTGKLVLNEVIHVITDSKDEDVISSISNDAGYDKHFTISYASNTVSLGLVEDLLPDDVLANSFIALTLTVAITGTTHTSSAVLNILINNGYDDNKSVALSNILYNGTYEETNGTPTLIIDDPITVVTDEPDSNIVVSLSGDYLNYFTVIYLNKIITVTILRPLPSDIRYISLLLQVQILGTTNRATAVLNISIQGSDDVVVRGDTCPMKTAYIVSIVLLCFVIIALIAAAVAFYYFKIRNRNYSNLDEERDSRARYDKNTPTRASTDFKRNPLEERRPTGFIFKPLEEDTAEATNDFDKNRRKSVAFDDNVEKMQIESPVDEDNASEDNYISNLSEDTHV